MIPFVSEQGKELITIKITNQLKKKKKLSPAIFHHLDWFHPMLPACGHMERVMTRGYVGDWLGRGPAPLVQMNGSGHHDVFVNGE